MNDRFFFLLYSACILVKGASRSSICDLQKNRIKLIPNLLFDILAMARNQTVGQIKDYFERQNDEGIDRYFEILIEQGYGFFTEEPHLFPEMNLSWESPCQITNAIVDFDFSSNHPIEKIINELSGLGCSALLLRFFHSVDDQYLQTVLSKIAGTRINSVGIVLDYREQFLDNIVEFYNRNRFVRNITFYSSPTDDYLEKAHVSIRVLMLKQAITSEQCCGVVDQSLFTINIRHFTESLAFNSCLNRKIGIDKTGLIKNCPSLKTDYGHIDQVSLKSAIENESFNSLWKIRKDEINICKDCEFRHICTDCRAYLNDPFSKPLKCGYDPYTSTWT